MPIWLGPHRKYKGHKLPYLMRLGHSSLRQLAGCSHASPPFSGFLRISGSSMPSSTLLHRSYCDYYATPGTHMPLTDTRPCTQCPIVDLGIFDKEESAVKDGKSES